MGVAPGVAGSRSRSRWESLQESAPAYLAREWEWESWESNPAIAARNQSREAAVQQCLTRTGRSLHSSDFNKMRLAFLLGFRPWNSGSLAMRFAVGFRSSRGHGAGDCSDVEKVSSGIFVLYSKLEPWTPLTSKSHAHRVTPALSSP